MFGVIRREGNARRLVTALFAFALLLRIAVPAGFMPIQTGHNIVISICDAMGDDKTMVVDFGRSDDGKQHPDHEKPTAPCIFAGLSAPTLVATPALAMALQTRVLVEFALPPPIRFSFPDTDFLTPPLRGPPAFA